MSDTNQTPDTENSAASAAETPTSTTSNTTTSSEQSGKGRPRFPWAEGEACNWRGPHRWKMFGAVFLIALLGFIAGRATSHHHDFRGHHGYDQRQMMDYGRGGYNGPQGYYGNPQAMQGGQQGFHGAPQGMHEGRH